MHNKIFDILKATIIKIIVAFLFILIFLLIYKASYKEKIETAASLVNMFAPMEIKTMTPVLNDINLNNKPIYGSKYATLKIPSIELELPVYYGESLAILKSGIGHDSHSYFPGEGGTIIYMGHNFKTFLARLPELKENDIIEIETEYGTFDYKVYQSKIVDENATDEAPIQRNEEILIIYTCWPINNIGHASQRYLVYAK